MDKGIDYGRGITNIDPDTGIRYGIIPIHALADWVVGEFEPRYGDPTCPRCGDAVNPSDDHDDYFCERCEEFFLPDECYPEDPSSLVYDRDGYQMQLDEHNDVWIFLSPFVTTAQFCSPCAPGACYLLNYTSDGEKAYCLPNDWFEDEHAPYPYTTKENQNND